MKHLDLNSTPPAGEFLGQRKNMLISHNVNFIQGVVNNKTLQEGQTSICLCEPDTFDFFNSKMET